jgi:hypothetical protein
MTKTYDEMTREDWRRAYRNFDRKPWEKAPALIREIDVFNGDAGPIDPARYVYDPASCNYIAASADYFEAGQPIVIPQEPIPPSI